ncbi:MAG: glycosyltransferase [Nodosilinea sp.]
MQLISQTPTSTISEPRVAIVIPVFKHSVLVGEAIVCALQQQTDFEAVIILVNDGCRYSETDRICREFALAHSKILYLYRCNGGLSAARNTGINFALSNWPSVEAIYLLDADNRITSGTLARAFQCLLADPDIGWIYPTINMFGQERNFDFRGKYSVLRHLTLNLCEAGSLVRRAVFEAGCRYDESMKLGYEDWEFWWQAIEAGFRGKHLADFGFQYRKRPESMLRNSERDSAGILDYMRRKHRKMFNHNYVMHLEQLEAPRYMIYLLDIGKVILTSDPNISDYSISVQEFHDIYGLGFSGTPWHYCPNFLVFTYSTVLQSLQRQGLARWAFWRLELAQAEVNFSILTIHSSSENHEVAFYENAPTLELVAGETDHLVMTSLNVLNECIKDPQDDWIHSLITPAPLPKILHLWLTYPNPDNDSLQGGGVLYQFLVVFKNIQRISRAYLAQSKWNWQSSPFPAPSQMFRETRQILNCDVVYPIVSAPEQRHVGFILPILEFGGVEKVALNIAQRLHEDGWSVHLFICNARMQKLPEWANFFKTINFLNEPGMYDWGGSKYMGSTYDNWSQTGNHQRVIGLLSWLDAVINFHGVAANGIMGLLRRSDVKTLASLHVHDLTPTGRPNGFSHLVLGYEHAYDFIIPCSEQMADWCHALGVPQDKLVVVPNAPGYPLAQVDIDAALTRRLDRASEQLRVVFIGRFDRQKGLDRLVSIVNESRKRRLPIEWRLIGKNIVQAQNATEELASVADLIEPPALTNAELNAVYEWADVLLLPSYWEGLPLTVLEAMRLGVVVCAADVGAVSEAIQHGQNGILVQQSGKNAFVEQVIDHLAELAEQPDQLMRLSLAAQAARPSWRQSCDQLLSQLNAAVAPIKAQQQQGFQAMFEVQKLNQRSHSSAIVLTK